MDEWVKQEKKLKKIHRGFRTPGSGNKGIKADVIGDVFVIEAKFSGVTDSKGRKYMDVSRDWLLKLSNELRGTKIPLLNLNIGNLTTLSIIPADQYDTRVMGTIDFNDKKQVRIYAEDTVEHYTVLIPHKKFPEWIILSDDDIEEILDEVRGPEIEIKVPKISKEEKIRQKADVKAFRKAEYRRYKRFKKGLPIDD
jgi:hypothetical protein